MDAAADSTVKAPAPATGCQVVEAEGGRFQVNVQGALTTGWAGRLAASLAARRMNVIRGGGARRGARLWDVELLVEPLDRTVDPRTLDYLALAQEGQAPDHLDEASIVIDNFVLTRTTAELVVDVEAVDALGFLDRLLRVFALYGLYPRELKLETRGQQVRDQFRLQGLGGQVPSLQVCEAVGLRLRALAGTEAP
jgi:hypothetical protein